MLLYHGKCIIRWHLRREYPWMPTLARNSGVGLIILLVVFGWASAKWRYRLRLPGTWKLVISPTAEKSCLYILEMINFLVFLAKKSPKVPQSRRMLKQKGGQWPPPTGFVSRVTCLSFRSVALISSSDQLFFASSRSIRIGIVDRCLGEMESWRAWRVGCRHS